MADDKKHEATRLRVSRRPRPPKFDYNEEWNGLARTFEQLHNGEGLQESFDMVFKKVYRICLQRKGHVLYNDTMAWHRNRLKRIWEAGTESFVAGAPPDPECSRGLLENFMNTWEKFWEAIHQVQNILSYQSRMEQNPMSACLKAFLSSVVLDETVKTEPQATTMLQLLVSTAYRHCYVESLDLDSNVRTHDLLGLCFKVLDGICMSLEEDNLMQIDALCPEDGFDAAPGHLANLRRRGFGESKTQEAKASATVESVRTHFLFKDSIGSVYLKPVRGFYHREAESLAARSSALSFCETAHSWLLNEIGRCHTILPRHMSGELRSLIINNALKPHINAVIDRDRSGLFYLLINGTMRQLGIIYEIVAMVDEHKAALSASIGHWLAPSTLQLEGLNNLSINDAGSQKPALHVWILGVLRLERRALLVVSQAFDSDTILEASVSRGISDLLSQQGTREEQIDVLRQLATEDVLDANPDHSTGASSFAMRAQHHIERITEHASMSTI